MAYSKTVSELVSSAQQLDTLELEMLLLEINQLYTQKHVRKNQQEEERLLKKIKSTNLSQRARVRWEYLIARRDLGILSSDEHAELLALTETVEKIDLERLKLMAKLSEVSQVPLANIPLHYGIRPN